MTDLGSKIEYCTLKSLKMSVAISFFFIRPAVSIRSQCYADLTSSQGGVPSWKFSNFTTVYLFGTCTNQTMRISMTWVAGGMQGT